MREQFLCDAEAKRVLKTLQKLSQHDVSGWALAGGLAVEIHRLRTGLSSSIGPLNDIDFVAAAFDCAPETLARDFLFRHVHPLDPPGKTILQLVDAETMRRTLSLELPFGPIQVISAEDVLAPTARLLLDLSGGVPVAAKHANDYLRLAKLTQTSDLQVAWQDHRKPYHPTMFREADSLVRDLIATHSNLLIKPEYSNDATQICSRCAPLVHFRWPLRTWYSRCSATVNTWLVCKP